MGFAGNLRTLSLVEIFQTLARIQGTGVLRLASQAGGRDVVFDAGKIIGVAFRAGERKQALLKRLILLGKIDAHAAASLSSTGSESQVVKAVVEQGWVSNEDVTAAYEQQAREELQSLASWDYADFVFEDAEPGDGLAMRLVERYRQFPIAVDMSHLLIESARRADEWVRMKQLIPDETQILAPVGRAQATLNRIASEYPASAVVPLVDGVRSIVDLVEESVASRLDVYGVLTELIEAKLVEPLTDERVLATADHLAGTLDFVRAARLYRLLLSRQDASPELTERLAACLSHLADPQEAAAALAQLAQRALDQEHGAEQAGAWAQQAVDLAPGRPDARLTLARCLIASGQHEAAAEQLHALVGIYLELGNLEEARATCLKILSLIPNDEGARRELARIFSRAEHDATSEDVVVCVRCDHVNHREAEACASCKTPLRLTCLSCGRVVCVSDKLCIFCGADPHAGTKRELPDGKPTTERFLRTDRIAQDKRTPDGAWKQEVSAAMQRALAAEQADNPAEALAAWREVASYQQDASDLQGRIRELEYRIGLKHIESCIANGHALRKGRRFWRAIRCYREALRLLPPGDARIGPLEQILVSTERWHRRNALIYAAAMAVLAVIGFLALQPYLQFSALQQQAIDVHAAIELGRIQGDDAIRDADAQLARLEERAGHIRGPQGQKAKRIVDELSGDLLLVKTQAAQRELKLIAGELDQGHSDQAAARIIAFGGAFGSLLADQLRPLELQLAARRREQAERQQTLAEAPVRLGKAQALEKAGALRDALAVYRSLTTLNDVTIAATATAAVARLQPLEQAVSERLARVTALCSQDLTAAAAACAPLEADAHAWGLEGALARLRASIASRLHLATVDWAALGDQADVPHLEAFCAAHPGAPEAAQAQARLTTLLRIAAAHTALLERYRAALAAHHWQQAWEAGHDLIGSGSTGISLPVVVETRPAGAFVSVNGHGVGTSPCVAALPPDIDGAVDISLPEWQAVQVPVAQARRSWQLQLDLVRQEAWKATLHHPATTLLAVGSDLVATGPDAIAAIDGSGHVRWSCGLPRGSDDISDNRPRSRLVPLPLPDGGLVVGLPDHGLLPIDAQGHAGAEIPSDAPVRGRPVLFTNDLMGEKQRLAYAAEVLSSSALGEDPVRIPLANAAIAGPVVIARDLERVLAIVDVRGHLIGVEESTRRPVWDLDLMASDCGQLVPISPVAAVAVLDGSRLACIGFGSTPSVRWMHPLSAPPVGDPLLLGSALLLAVGDSVLRLSLEGVPQGSWSVGGTIACPIAGLGNVVAVGLQDAHLVVYHGDHPAWSTALPAVPTALAVLPQGVVVALGDGTILAFPP